MSWSQWLKMKERTSTRRSLLAAFLCLALVSMGIIAHAGEVSFLSDPGPSGNALWLIDPISNQPYGQVGIFPSDSRWDIAQWGILNPLPLKTRRYGKGWKVQNRDARVWVYPNENGGYVVDLKQTSRNPAYGSREFDLFLGPNHFVLPGLPQNLMHYNDQPSLASLTSVHMKARQEVISAWHGTRASKFMGTPGYDCASTLLAVAMINPYRSPEQVLFYQIITYDSRGWLFDGFWFNGGTDNAPYVSYGVSDSVQNYGLAGLVPRRPQAYNLEIGDRLRELVLTGPSSLDKDFTHWKVGGDLYFGSILNGEAAIRTRIDSIDFTYRN
jgi:hypothetical protein